ncbi:unnamed protein product [Durusdinium trenchii]|uniref:Right handed beta helix domain-containing protein n=1 Tax=Durusdinium trenchii TaxID=1381693 RepID=A0ABP0KQJ8_9DINO
MMLPFAALILLTWVFATPLATAWEKSVTDLGHTFDQSSQSHSQSPGRRLQVEPCPVVRWIELCKGFLEAGSCAQLSKFDPSNVRGGCRLRGPPTSAAPARLLGIGGLVTMKTGEELRISGNLHMTSLRLEAGTLIFENAQVVTSPEPPPGAENSAIKGGAFRSYGRVIFANSNVTVSSGAAKEGGGIAADGKIGAASADLMLIASSLRVQNTAAKEFGGGIVASSALRLQSFDAAARTLLLDADVDIKELDALAQASSSTSSTLTIMNSTAATAGGFFAIGPVVVTGMSAINISDSHAVADDEGIGGGFSTLGKLRVNGSSTIQIQRTTAPVMGGGFQAAQGIVVTGMSRMTISDSSSQRTGGGFFSYKGLEVTNRSTLRIHKAMAGGTGGAFRVEEALVSGMSAVIVSDSRCLSGVGGGVFAQSLQVSHGSNLSIRNAFAGGKGGGIAATTLHVTNGSKVIVKNAKSQGSGGCSYNSNVMIERTSTLSLSDCHALSENSVGGALQAMRGVQVKDNSHLYIRNSSSMRSGGGFDSGSHVVIAGMSNISILNSHTVSGNGGGFSADKSLRVTRGSTLSIQNARAGQHGGGFFAIENVVVTDNSTCSIHNSTAGSSGGGFLADGEVVIDGQSKVKMFDCHAITGDGGGFATRTLAGANVDRRLQVSGNSALSIHKATAGANGGGFYVEDDLEANSSIIEIFNSSAGEDGGGFNVGRALLGDCEVRIRGAAAEHVAGGFAIRSGLFLSSGSISIVNSTADSGAGGLVKGPAILTHSKLAISDAGGDEYSAVLVANCLQLGPKSAFLMEDVNGGHGLDLRNVGCVCTAGTLQVASDATLQASGDLSSSFMKVAACPSETVYLSGIHLQSWSSALWSSGGSPPSHVVVENVSVDFEPQLDNVQLLEVEEGFTINSLVVSCPSCTNGVTFISTEHSLHAFSPKADLKCPNQVMVLNGTTPRCTCTDYKITNERFRGMQVVPVEDVFNTCAFCKLHQHYVDGGKCEKCPLYTAWSDGETDVCHMLPREEAERTAILTGAIIFVVSAFILLQLLAAPLYVVDARSDAVNDPPEEVPQRSFAMSVQGPIVDLPKQMSARVHELVSYRITGTGLQWLDFDAEKANNVKVCGVSRRKLRLKDAHAPFDCAACGGVLHPTETGRLFFLIVGILFIFVLLPVAIQVSVASGNTFQHTLVTLAICILPIGVVAALLYYPVACLIRWRYQRTPYADTLSEYQKQIQRKLHPGPDADHPKNQGLLASTLYELWKHFESFILERNMHFIVANIVTPLTSQRQTSFVGLWGGRKVDYFVSHSWGTSFAHFTQSIRCHALSKEGSTWMDTSYWICSFANNQWKIKEDLGSTIMESAFARALTGGVKGTVMVLDHEVQPLTRVWCLFEFLLSSRENLELVFSTDVGVVGDGSCTSFDIALKLGKKIKCLQVANCQASSEQDKNDIFNYIVSELGSLQNMDEQIRRLMGQMLKKNLANIGGATDSLLHRLGQN